jgi:YD repeat-containing protein
MRNEQGNRIQLKRDKVRNLETLTSPSGHTISFKYDGSNRIIEAEDNSGNIRRYFYNSSGHLESLSDGSHMLYRFGYEPLLHERGYDPYLMTTVSDGDGKVLLKNFYKDGRVSEQRLADGEVIRCEYLYDLQHNLIGTTVTLPSGEVKHFRFYKGITYASE